ncbi:MAG: citramalate synthase [Nitrospirae bacterium]|nr:citramalate synthase [Nitrospirota bacterium]
MRKILIYDTTLRDGAQAEDVSFTLEDKLRIVGKLDSLGVHYIEGGFPGANPKDTRFFKEVKNLHLNNSKIVAFGSTKKAATNVKKDPNITALLQAETGCVTIVGKSWDFHVTEALGITLKKNLEMIKESVSYLKSEGKYVFFDAEHYFDGFKANAEFAIQTLQASLEGGADCVVLCDTNGGTMPDDIKRIFKDTRREVKVSYGIHAHNDSDLAVANSIMAVEAGASHVQGTINGLGERCGNANLCSIIPNLKLKLDIDCIPDQQLRNLRNVSHFVSEIANIPPNRRQPYVGDSAFTHKGGLHVHAVRKKSNTYEHVNPGDVGNVRRMLVSDYSGISTILQKAGDYGIIVKQEDHPKLQNVLNVLKEMEDKGYQFEGAEGSFELLMKRSLGLHKSFFNLIGFRVIVEKRKEGASTESEATIMLNVDGDIEHTAAVGNGPVNALDNALRKALEKFYPSLKDVGLIDYKVRVLTGVRGTASRVRVLIESGDKQRKWGTVGVSDNIIEASWLALVDSIEYKLLKDKVMNDG